MDDVDGETLQVTMTHTNETLFPGLQLVGSGSTWRIEADSADNAFGTDTVTVKYTKEDPNKPGAPAPEVIDQNSSGSQNSSGQSGTNNGSTSPYGTNTYNNGN